MERCGNGEPESSHEVANSKSNDGKFRLIRNSEIYISELLLFIYIRFVWHGP